MAEPFLRTDHRFELRQFDTPDVELGANRPDQRTLFLMHTIFGEYDFENQANKQYAQFRAPGGDA